eukprot:1079194-Pyramimonas_sp.AAC.1
MLERLPLATCTDTVAEVGPNPAARAAPDQEFREARKPTRPITEHRSNEVERGPGSFLSSQLRG